MKTYNVPTKENALPETQALFAMLEQEKGLVPNIYAFIGNAPAALTNFMAFEQSLTKSTFTAKEQEAIFLAVSSVNGCRYCQSAHTYIAKSMGFTQEETVQIRQGTHPDPKIGAITRLAAAIQATHGKPDKALLEAFFEQGYREAALVDLLSVIIFFVMPNYLNNVTEIPIDFPLATNL